MKTIKMNIAIMTMTLFIGFLLASSKNCLDTIWNSIVFIFTNYCSRSATKSIIQITT